MSTMSASPLRTIWSAWAGSVIMPTAAVAIPASRRTACANGNLIAGADGYFRALDIAARRAIDRVDAELLQPARKRDRLLEVPTAVGPVGRRNADEQRTGV